MVEVEKNSASRAQYNSDETGDGEDDDEDDADGGGVVHDCMCE
jgi:hypothetical protein